jgi:hypothetical protein
VKQFQPFLYRPQWDSTAFHTSTVHTLAYLDGHVPGEPRLPCPSAAEDEPQAALPKPGPEIKDKQSLQTTAQHPAGHCISIMMKSRLNLVMADDDRFRGPINGQFIPSAAANSIRDLG